MRTKIIKIIIGLLILLILGLIGSFYLMMPEDIDQNIEVEVPKVYSLKLSAVGDVLIHGVVYNSAYENGEYDFKPKISLVKPLVEDSDISFYNQETILGGVELGLSTYPRFNSPYEVGDAMLDAGFNLVSRANNHTLDRGEDAIINADNYWDSKDNVLTYGSSSKSLSLEDIPIGEVNNISYGFLAYTTLTNGLKAPTGKEYFVATYDKEKVKEDIEYLKDKVDVVIVSMHWGSEYTFTPTASEVEISEYLSSLGVDLVIGHHPHVVQPVTYVGDTLVIYSLGNFISGQLEVNKKVGLLVNLEIQKIVFDGNSLTRIKNVEGDFIYTLKNSPLGKYVVYPFSNLNNDLLNNYEKIYQEYTSYVKIDDTIIMKGLDN